MLVHVMYEDGRFDMVRNDMLDILLANMKIRKFRRASGWIDAASGLVRQRFGASWEGPERRAPWPNYKGHIGHS